MNARILLVEDSRTFQAAVAEGLGELGHTVVCVMTLKEAKEALGQQKFDFILLDLNLPDGSGKEIIEHTRNRPDTRIVVLTGSDDTVMRENLFQEGVIDYFSKENRLEFILEKLQELILDVLVKNARKKIMLVGGDVTVFEPIEIILQRRNYAYDVFIHQRDVLAHYWKGYRLAFLDAETTVGNPLELIKTLRTKKNSVELPIIVFSRNTDPDNAAKWLKSGANDFVQHPFLIERFLLEAEQMISASIAGAELRRQELKFRLLADNSSDLIVKHDARGAIDYVSPACQPLLGLPTGRMRKMNLFDLLHPEEKEEYQHQIEKCVLPDCSKRIICRLKHAEGHYVWMESGIRPIVLPGKEKVLDWQVSFRDITQRKQLEEEVIERSRQAAVGEIITTLSHQWRQPITRLGMIANNLQLDAEMGMLEGDSILKKASQITEQVALLSKMIDLFRNAFSGDKTKEPVLLKEVVQMALDTLESEILNVGVEVQFQGSDQIPAWANRTEMIQVFHGFFKNSLEAFQKAKTETPRMQISSWDEREQGRVLVRIRDNAGGISQELLQKIFEPYSSTKGNIGSGIGLYLTRIIIEERHQGKLRAGNANDGALFEMELPIYQGDGEALTPAANPHFPKEQT